MKKHLYNTLLLGFTLAVSASGCFAVTAKESVKEIEKAVLHNLETLDHGWYVQEENEKEQLAIDRKIRMFEGKK